jgi:hypothetical protein
VRGPARRPAAALAAAILASITLTARSPAAAVSPDFGGRVGDGQVSVHVEVAMPGVGAPLDLARNTSTPAVDFSVVDPGPARLGDLTALCLAGSDDRGQPVLGYLHRVIGTERATQRIVYDDTSCVPVTVPDAGARRPPVPQLPTLEEAWRAARLEAPTIRLDPSARGITGLDTRIWTDGPSSIAVSASVRGYAIIGTATVAGYTVRVDDEPPVTAGVSGDAAHPIAHHTFETKGRHLVRVGVVWRGRATFAGPDLAEPIEVDIGAATITSTRVYQVNEVRSILLPHRAARLP